MKILLHPFLRWGYAAAVLALVWVAPAVGFAKEVPVLLTIAEQTVHITGTPTKKLTVNGSLPAPVLQFTEGDTAVIHVKNTLTENTSLHWHGLLLPGEMDGVPGLNGFNGIAPGETFTYRFVLRQSGTYWYHAHSGGQEQDGLYGALIVAPKQPTIQADRDYVVLLSDFHTDSANNIIKNLKMSAEYYQYARRTVGDFWADVQREGWQKAWDNAKMWATMRMAPTDLADVAGYTFLINGKTPTENWTGVFSPGQVVRLRFINASAMSFYDVRIPGLKMTVVAADGQNIEPVVVDEFRFGVAETYDVLVTPTEAKAYTIAAESIDRSGFALATLAPKLGMAGAAPTPRPRALLTMADMGMAHPPAGSHAGTAAHGTSPTSHHNGGHTATHQQAQHATMQHDKTGPAPAAPPQPNTPVFGWANAATPAGNKALDYADLRYAGTQTDTRQPQRTIEVRLGGTMERYIWTLNGKKYTEAEPVQLTYGERARLTFVNDTMMAHPMHLHGMFVQLENGQPAEKLPNKHTVVVPPGQSYSVLLTADEAGEWAFHCHLLYHMMSGMMTKVVVAKLDNTHQTTPAQHAAPHTKNTQETSHAHQH